MNKSETAAHLMTSKVPVIENTATILDVEKMLLEKTADFESINYIYIVDSEKKLKGVLSVKEVFRSKKSMSVKDVMAKKIISVRAHTDQQHVGILALRHGFKEIPVIDKDDYFLGAVPADTIFRILDNEAVEDIFRFSGVLRHARFDNVFDISLFKSLKHRLPWLIIGLFGGLITAGILNKFEETLSQNIILAAFIPLIVYMASAVGTQMEIFIIRDLAVNPKLEFLKYFLKQVTVVLFISIITSIILYLLSLFLYNNEKISMVLAVALFFSILSSLLTGLVVPFLFNKLKMDPANASGPIATIVQDLLSVIVYFSVATILL